MDEIDEGEDPVDEWINAAGQGDLAIVLEHLDRGMDVNALSSIGGTALMMAVRDRHLDVIRVLLEHGASLAPENSLGYTAVTYAVIASRSWEKYWVNPRPDPRPLDLLLAAGGRYGLREAVILNDVDLARARLDEGADPSTGYFTYDGPLLKIAVELGHVEIVDLLLERGADIEATDDLGQRPLMSAANFGQTEAVRHLLKHGADIDAVGWCGETALSNSLVAGHHELFHLLLSHGARRGLIDAIFLNEPTLVQSLVEQELHRSEFHVDSLSSLNYRVAFDAVRMGHVPLVNFLLDRGAAQLSKWEPHSLLAEAAAHGRVDVARLLIDRGADLHAVGDDGLTPLEWAVREGRNEAYNLLKQAGAER